MIPSSELAGLVLSGGRGSRLQSLAVHEPVEKGLVCIHGRPLVAHACAYLAPWVSCTLISANRHLDRYAAYGRVVTDDPALGADQGPLAGLASALAVAPLPWVLVVPVDSLALPADLPVRLWQAAQQAGALLAYARSGADDHPLCALVHRDLAGSVYSQVAQGQRRVRSWFQSQGAAVAVYPDDQDRFLNVNTPQALAEANGQAPHQAQAAGA